MCDELKKNNVIVVKVTENCEEQTNNVFYNMERDLLNIMNEGAEITSTSGDEKVSEDLIAPRTPTREKRRRRASDVIDSLGDREMVSPVSNRIPGFATPRRPSRNENDVISPDQGYSGTPEAAHFATEIECVNNLVQDWIENRCSQNSAHDATPQNSPPENAHAGTSYEITGAMTAVIDCERYNMSYKNRGKCVIFNHEEFDTGFNERRGSTIDVKRITQTFSKLGFSIEVHKDLTHRNVMDKVEELSAEDHNDSDCLCIFILTHGSNNDLIHAKDAAYRTDCIWKPFTADRCTSLAGKPKLFFFQACRGDKLDAGIRMVRKSIAEIDELSCSYKIPTHADFLIAHSTAQGFYSWRHPDEGTWYIQSLCDIIDSHAETTDITKILTMTGRKVATEYTSFNNADSNFHDQTQIPSFTSMLIRELYFPKK